jgi:hypothetical protein
MLDFNLHSFMSSLRELVEIEQRCHAQRQEEHVGIRPVTFGAPKGSQFLSVPDKTRLQFLLAEINKSATALALGNTVAGYTKSFLDRLAEVRTPPDIGEVESRIQKIRESVEFELQGKSFMLLPNDKVAFWKNEKPFGENVAEKFKKATEDLKEAGKCLAAGRSTAAVFHLMRVMEVGLHRLAARFKVGGLTGKTWGTVIGEIEDVLRPRKRNPRTKNAAVAHDPAIAYFRSAKDGWRDRVCHSNVVYSEPQAEHVYSATKGFMTELAELF